MLNPKNENGDVHVRFVRGPANGKRIYIPADKVYTGYEHNVYIQFNQRGKRMGLDLALPRRAMIDGVAFRSEVRYLLCRLPVEIPSKGIEHIFYFSPWFSTSAEDVASRFAP